MLQTNISSDIPTNHTYMNSTYPFWLELDTPKSCIYHGVHQSQSMWCKELPLNLCLKTTAIIKLCQGIRERGSRHRIFHLEAVIIPPTSKFEKWKKNTRWTLNYLLWSPTCSVSKTTFSVISVVQLFNAYLCPWSLEWSSSCRDLYIDFLFGHSDQKILPVARFTRSCSIWESNYPQIENNFHMSIWDGGHPNWTTHLKKGCSSGNLPQVFGGKKDAI